MSDPVIPADVLEEAARRFPYGPIATVGDYQKDIFREVFADGARWARKQALQDARAIVDGPNPANSGLDSFTLAHVSAAIDALIEGKTQ